LRNSVVIAVALLWLPSAVLAASINEPKFSETYNRCMGAAGGSDPGMTDCTDAELARQDARLNRTYKVVMTELSPDRQMKLRLEERAWLKATKSRCEHAGDENEGGTAQPLQILDCYLSETIKRANVLASYPR
jgi:uncharacterized protein YecT (DUF1311 family)